MSIVLVVVAMLLPDGSGAVLPWPSIGDSPLCVDPLSAFFLVPVFFLGGLGSVYCLGILTAGPIRRDRAEAPAVLGTLVACMSLLVIGRNAMSFLLGREAGLVSASRLAFAASVVSFFGWVLRPGLTRSGAGGPLPAKAEMSRHVYDAVLDRVLDPTAHAAAHAAERRFGLLGSLQRVETHIHILNIIITLIAMLGTMVPVRDPVARLFAL